MHKMLQSSNVAREHAHLLHCVYVYTIGVEMSV